VPLKPPPRDAWSTTPVVQVMMPMPLKTVAPDTDLAVALRLLVEGRFHQLPVLTDGTVVGMLDRADILRFVQLRDAFGPVPPSQQPPSRRAGGATRDAR
jgi:CBS-domain-containing membrane protein